MTIHAAQPLPAASAPAPAHALERIIVYGNPDKATGLGPVLRDLEGWCQRRGIKLWIEEALAPIVGVERPKDGTWPGLGPGSSLPNAPAVRPIYVFAAAKDRAAAVPEKAGGLVICLGGDGTLLHAVRRLWPLNGTPVLAVNLGSLSFNASVEAAQITQGIEQWMAGEATVSERLVLAVKLVENDNGTERIVEESHALNDVVLTKPAETRLLHVRARQGGEDVFGFAGDGVIISTATGSTAYNLSAGGPILFPTLPAVALTPICAHTLSLRPVVLAPAPKLELTFIPHHGREKSLVYIDGQEAQFLGPGDRVEIEAASEPLKLVQLPGMSYFERLREKMHWGGELYSPGEGEKE